MTKSIMIVLLINLTLALFSFLAKAQAGEAVPLSELIKGIEFSVGEIQNANPAPHCKATLQTDSNGLTLVVTDVRGSATLQISTTDSVSFTSNTSNANFDNQVTTSYYQVSNNTGFVKGTVTIYDGLEAMPLGLGIRTGTIEHSCGPYDDN